MMKSRIGLVLNRVMVLIIATHVGAARAEQAASEPSAADPKASAQEKQPREQSAAAGQEATLYPIPNSSGDIWSRSYFTADWGGLRTRLANNGVQFEFNVTQIFQGVASGGLNQTARYSGSTDIVLKLDSQKLGLWPGGFLFVEAQVPFGNTVSPYSGGVLPVNALLAMTAPAINE